MIHAYDSIWRCLMHNMIIEIIDKACVYVHHLHTRMEMEKMSAILQRIIER